jgi:hypothetical protein
MGGRADTPFLDAIGKGFSSAKERVGEPLAAATPRFGVVGALVESQPQMLAGVGEAVLDHLLFVSDPLVQG